MLIGKFAVPDWGRQVEVDHNTDFQHIHRGSSSIEEIDTDGSCLLGQASERHGTTLFSTGIAQLVFPYH